MKMHILAAMALLPALAACSHSEPPPSGLGWDTPEPPDPRHLVGTSWRLIEADGVRIDRAGGYNPPILRIESERITGHGGCNAFGARYRTRGFAFVVEELESTQIGCPNPVGPLEERLFRVLSAPFEWGTSKPDGRFTIIGGRERAVFVFEPIAG